MDTLLEVRIQHAGYSDHPQEDSESLQGYALGVEETVIGRIELAQLREMLAGLPYEKRAVLILKHYHGWKYKEIAEALNCPVGTVRSRLHYCINFIKLFTPVLLIPLTRKRYRSELKEVP